MITSTVVHLRLRASATRATQARFRAEDALRLAVPDDRLLVLRRLDLGRVPVRATAEQWADRADERVRAQASRAVHAAAPGAAAADAVWFHSFEEARALLLRELAAGRMPAAWFWRLAVRTWQGRTLAEWLPRLLADATTDPTVEPALARMMVDMAESSRLAILIAALASAPVPAAPRRPAPVTRPTHAASAATDPGAGPTPIRAEPTEPTLLSRLPTQVRLAILAALAGLPRTHPARSWIARLALIAAEPAILSQPALLQAMAEGLATIQEAPYSARAEPHVGAAAPGTAEPVRAEPSGRGEPATSAPSDAPATTLRRAGATGSPAEAASTPPAKPTLTPDPDRTGDARDDPAPWHDPSVERRSLAGGLFLLIPPLIRMGFPGWLDANPGMTAEGFPRAMLHAIALRMRIPADDPVFAVLGWTGEPCWPESITAWRVGLDRWLRRTARIRLAQVVCRRGWIAGSDAHLSVRFRTDDADIRLRRKALDVDPGWVPWFGAVVRYHYRDEPLA